jgi:TPP-dependent 2-oxoacid decarboxylase
MIEYKRIRVDLRPESAAKPDAKLVRAEIVRQIHPLLTADTTVIAETGDSWFNAIGLKLPPSDAIRSSSTSKKGWRALATSSGRIFALKN